MMVAALLAIVFSGALLILLGARDPKRLRNARHGTTEGSSVTPALPGTVRRICSWLVLLPGVALAVAGQWWAFLIWLGAITALGWSIAITAGYSSGAASHRTRS